MSDATDNGDEGAGVADLRRKYEDQKKALGAALEKVSGFEAKERANSVTQILTSKGFKPEHAKFYTADDVSEDAVGKWADENAPLFGLTKQTSEQDANAAAAARAAGVSFGNVSSIQNSETQVLGDPDALLKAIQTLPYDELVKQGIMPKEGQLFNPPRH